MVLITKKLQFIGLSITLCSLMSLFCPSLASDIKKNKRLPIFANTIFIDKGACPYEGCFYGFWRVESDFPLYDKVNGQHVIGIAQKGSNIKSLTGEVHTLPDILKIKPNAVSTDNNNPNHYTANQPIYVLTYLGEAIFRTWHDGRFYEDNTIYCVVPGMGDCNPKLDIYDLVRPGKRVWWVKIQLANKKIGWAKSIDSIGFPVSHADLFSGEPQLKGFYDKRK